MGGLTRGINAEGLKSLPEVRDQVREVLLDRKLRRFLERYHNGLYRRLVMFNSVMCYTYLINLQKSIETDLPFKNGHYKPKALDDIIQTINALQELYPQT